MKVGVATVLWCCALAVVSGWMGYALGLRVGVRHSEQRVESAEKAIYFGNLEAAKASIRSLNAEITREVQPFYLVFTDWRGDPGFGPVDNRIAVAHALQTSGFSTELFPSLAGGTWGLKEVEVRRTCFGAFRSLMCDALRRGMLQIVSTLPREPDPDLAAEKRRFLSHFLFTSVSTDVPAESLDAEAFADLCRLRLSELEESIGPRRIAGDRNEAAASSPATPAVRATQPTR
jgi:hypothetical protein